MPRPPLNQPMSVDELYEAESTRSTNKLHKDRSADLAELTRRIKQDLSEDRPRIKLVNGDLQAIKKQVLLYLGACEKYATLPTVQGLSRALGHSRRNLYNFLDKHPDSAVASYLEQVRDALSETLDLASLENSVNPIIAIFLQKSLFGRYDRAELYLSTSQPTDPLGAAETQEQIEARRAKYALSVPSED